jgi:hypothetical protein
MEKPTRLPPSVRGILGECNLLVSQGLLEDASAILKEFLATNGEHPIILRGIAKIYMLQHKSQDAVELLKRALALMGEKNEPSSSNSIHVHPLETPCQAESAHISNVDLEIIADTEAEIRSKREYFRDENNIENVVNPIQKLQNNKIYNKGNLEDGSTKIISGIESPIFELNGATFKASSNSIMVYKLNPCMPDDSCGNHGADMEVEQDFSIIEASLSVDEFDIDDDIADNDWTEEFVLEKTPAPVEHHYEYAWEESEPVGVDFDEDVSAADFINVRSESKLSRFERARQIALQLGSEYEWDESGVQLLTKIFFRYWWGATQNSLRRELAAGLTPVELALAEQAREIWYQYPEFSEEYIYSGEVVYKYHHLPWPSALALIRNFGGYPDIEEVEKLLIDIYEHWRESPSIMKKFVSFRLYLDYRLGRSRGSLAGPAWLTFETNDLGLENWQAHDYSETVGEKLIQAELLRLGVDVETRAINRIRLTKHSSELDADTKSKSAAHG